MLAGRVGCGGRVVVRRIALDRHPIPVSRLRVVVPDRQMLRAAIVPKPDRVRAPLETAVEQAIASAVPTLVEKPANREQQ